ncbi:hypothetical protein B5X24_HaOG211316 [Helicoverpa armigera]|uniref:Uncharacterized protein n=1 Tax=Helicoverpa armigera TaxID=29058 RepID=A0A2W1BEU0_HELAM|nr:hypothetical protein B5X24_HaOG211316 [Helicoverpa armigera]
MAAKTLLVLCAQAVLFQCAFSQCLNRGIDASAYGLGSSYGLTGLAGPGLANGLAGANFAGRGLASDGFYSPAMEFTATSGGSLPVTSTSAIAPTGISIVSENVFEGPLSVAGELPFVGTTGMEGAMSSAGAGAINHACGNGVTAMSSDSAAFGPGAAIPPIAATFPVSGVAPVSSYGVPQAGRFGLNGCAGNVLY